MISGIFIIIMMAAFFTMVAWAWSSKRKDEFEHLSNLPLEDNFGENHTDIANKKGEQNGNV
ncbi:hypothetical protein MNBD_GAMMA01-545 [hydrothermal vent metagenome]|uniref:Cytochrome c oxidase subunit CcoQ n=1 Tax=hydrothermal vent metagenome TaxID=652676 RepID=A0A3B0VNG6_9ZZZZ